MTFSISHDMVKRIASIYAKQLPRKNLMSIEIQKEEVSLIKDLCRLYIPFIFMHINLLLK